MIAPALCGDHPGKRMTYGHSLVIDPWGEVIAEGGESPGVVYADLDLARVDEGARPCCRRSPTTGRLRRPRTLSEFHPTDSLHEDH